MAPISIGRRAAGENRGGPVAAVRRVALAVAMTGLLGCAAESAPQRSAEAAFSLPAPRTAGTVSVEDALAKRRSVRAITPDPLAHADIGQLLWAAQGITDPASGHRTSPSAGALYPLEVYAVTAEGVFHYLPRGHQLERVLAGDLRADLATAALGQAVVAGAGVDFVVTGVVSRTRQKYGDRAERFVFMEAGHAAENLLLQATAMGLGAVSIGGFSDDAVDTLLALPDGEQALYILAVGKRHE